MDANIFPHRTGTSIAFAGLLACIPLLPATAAAFHVLESPDAGNSCSSTFVLPGRNDIIVDGRVSTSDLHDVYSLFVYRSEIVSWTVSSSTTSDQFRAGFGNCFPSLKTCTLTCSGTFAASSTDDFAGEVDYVSAGDGAVDYDFSLPVRPNDMGTGTDAGPKSAPTPIAPGTGTGALPAPNGVRGPTSGTLEEDWYAVTVPVLSRIQASMAPDSQSNFALHVCDPLGTCKRSDGGGQGASESVSCGTLTGGVFKVGVVPSNSGTIGGGYSLGVSFLLGTDVPCA